MRTALRRALALLVFVNAISSAGAQTCEPCEAGTWCFDNNKFTCGQHATSLNASDSASDCVCVDGYARGGDGVCALCDASVVCAASVVTSCPENSLAASGSWDLAQCVCVPGHERVAGVCVPCGAGFFKATSGDGACAACAAGAFAGGGAAACELCAVGDSTTTGAAASHADCVCRAGFYGDASSAAGACAACPRGTFLTTSGAATIDACVDCAAQGVTSTVVSGAAARRLLSAVEIEPLPTHSDSQYYSTVEGASSADVCAVCPEFSRVVNTSGASGGNVSDCVCFEGHRRDAAGVCVKCAPGTFKNTTGPDACTMCPADTYNHRTGSFAASACMACPFTLGSLPGADDLARCRCPPGEEGTPETGCAACANGTVQPFTLLDYRDGTATAIGCTPCPEGTYGSNGLTCADCPANSSSVPGSAALEECACERGMTLSRTTLTCVQCPRGTFKATVGNAPCSWCAIGTYGPHTGQTMCTSCSPGASSSVHSTSVFNCTCGAGLRTIFDEGVDVSGSTVFRSTWCGPCTTSISTLSSTMLPHFATLEDEIAGVVSVRNVALRECAGCPVNTFSSPGVCTPCPAASTAPENTSSVQQCQCTPGHNMSVVDGELACVPCAPGTARGALAVNCFACAAGTFSQGGATACTRCAAGSFQSATGATACVRCGDNAGGYQLGAVSMAGCVCLPGFAPAGDACVPCAAGFYDEGNRTRNASCVECPVSQTTASGAVGQASCAPCAAGTMYGGRQHGCRVCPIGTRVEDGARRDCECPPGFAGRVVSGDAPLQCEACAIGSYKAEFGNVICEQCANATVGRVIASWQARASQEDACVPCSAAHYKFNSTTCLPCQANSERPAGAGAQRHDCVCLPGFELVLGRCRACRAGYFKSVHGNGACSACTLGTYSTRIAASSSAMCTPCPPNSTQGAHIVQRSSVDTCACVPGTVPRRSPSVLVCEPCSLGSFSLVHDVAGCQACGANEYYASASVRDEDLCTACPGNSTSQPASVLVASCTCNPGWRRTYDAGSVQCSECGNNTYCPDGVQHMQCPQHSGTLGLTTATSAASCVCERGYFRDLDAGCVICPAGSFCVDNERFICPPNSHTQTLPGRFSINDCRCAAGFERNMSITSTAHGTQHALCSACPPDTYCSSGLRIACPSNSSSVAQATSSAQCLCDFGFIAVLVNDTMTCEVCDGSRVCLPPLLVVHTVMRQKRGGAVVSVRSVDNVLDVRLGAARSIWQVRVRSNVTQFVTLQLPGRLAWSATALSAGWLRAAHTHLANNMSIANIVSHLSFTVQHDSMDEQSVRELVQEKLTVYFLTLQEDFITLETTRAEPYAGTVLVELKTFKQITFMASSFASLVLGAGITVADAVLTVRAQFVEMDSALTSSSYGIEITDDRLSGLEEACIAVMRDMHSNGIVRRLLSSDDVVTAQDIDSSVTMTTSDTQADTSSLDGTASASSATTSTVSFASTSTTAQAGESFECAVGASSAAAALSCVCSAGLKCSANSEYGCVLPATCVPCSDTEICINNEATACAPFSRVPVDEAGTGTTRSCRCEAGRFRDPPDAQTAYTCEPCRVGSYCRNEVSIACATHDDDLLQSPAMADDVGDCFCRAGFFQMQTGDKCKPCPVDFYCPSTSPFVAINVVPCQPFAVTVGEASTSKDNCECRAGFKVSLLAPETCMPCQGAELCSAVPNAIDRNCPLSPLIGGLQTSPNADHTECECPAGAYRSTVSQDCVLCEAGKFADTQGFEGTCTWCPDGQYPVDSNGRQSWDTARYTGGVTCIACEAGAVMYTYGGQSTCVCDEDHTIDGGAGQCEQCAADRYFHTYPHSEVHMRGALGVCAACPSRTFVIKPGNESFTGFGMRQQCDCPIGMFLGPTTAQTTYRDYAICESCNGYEASRDQCVQCPPGMQRITHPQQYGDAAGCECVASYLENVDVGCWHGSVSYVDHVATTYGWDRSTLAVHQLWEFSTELPVPKCSNDCPNKPQTADNRDVVQCTECVAGEVQPDAVLEACKLCESDTYSDAAQQTLCTSCPPGEITLNDGADSVDLCVCPAGQTRDTAGTCVGCDVGTSKALPGDSPCTPCPTGTFQALTGRTSCDSCFTRTTLSSGSVSAADCVCKAGQYEDTDSKVCMACPCGSYKDTPGNEHCTRCGGSGHGLEHHYGDCSITGDDGLHSTIMHCTQCPDYSGQNSDLVDAYNAIMDDVSKCLCLPGFQYNAAGQCVPCPAFQHKTQYGNAGCEFCGVAEYWTEAHLPCGQCMILEADEPPHLESSQHRQAWNPSYNHMWAQSVDDCRCRVGFHVTNDGVDDYCTACGAGTSQADLSVLTCVDCAPGTYQPSTAQISCSECGAEQISPAGSSSATSCACPAGQQASADPLVCTACPAGKSKSTQTVISCVECANGYYVESEGQATCDPCSDVNAQMVSVTNAPRDDRRSCLCSGNDGFGDSGTCEPCEVGAFRQFKNIPAWAAVPGTIRASICEACPANRLTRGTGKGQREDCLAAAGFQPSSLEAGDRNLRNCVKCQIGKYKARISDDECIACSAQDGAGSAVAGTTELEGSVSFTDCQCNADLGYK